MTGLSRTRVGYTLAILFAINLINFFDRMIPSVVLEPIRREFNLGDTTLGILGTAFTLIYALAGIPLGRLSDRFSRTRILAAGVFVWSVLTAASGVATNFVSFFLVRLGVGIGEASCAPASNSLIGDLFPSDKRSRAFALFMLGLPIGSLACFAIVGYVAQKYGWRFSFFLAAVPGLILAILALLLKEPERGAQESFNLDTSVEVTRPFYKILSVSTVWWIILAGTAINFAAYAMSTFLAAFISRFHGLNIAQAGGLSAIILGVTGIIALPIGGYLADRAHRAHPQGRLLMGAICFVLAVPLLWLGFNQVAGQAQRMTIFLSVGWIFYFAFFISAYPSLQDVVEPRLRATAMALFFFFTYVLGGGAGSLVTGIVSDHFANSVMLANGATELNDAMRGMGLQKALLLLVPAAMLMTAIMTFMASRSFVRDSAKMTNSLMAAQAPTQGSASNIKVHA